MIAADIAELDSRLKQLTLQIRDKELSLFTVNFGVLGTKAAFLCGLGWSGLTMKPTWHGTHEPTQVALVAFYTLDALSVCFNLLTMALSTWCMVNGPMLAIRGPSGSMTDSDRRYDDVEGAALTCNQPVWSEDRVPLVGSVAHCENASATGAFAP